MSNTSPVLINADDPTSVDHVQNHIKLLITFLKDYTWLTDAYLSDYFTRSHSENIKPSWWHALRNMNLSELASFLHPQHWEASDVWPLSLLAFRAAVHALPLRRLPVDPACGLNKLHPQVNVTDTIDSQDSPPPPRDGEHSAASDIKDGQCPLLEHCYRRHVKPKKQHEILILAKVVAGLGRQCACSQVVDVGAGQGHLSRLLSFGYGLQVTTIEAAGCHAPKAERFDSEVRRDISRGQCISRKKRKKLKEEVGDRALEPPIANGPDPNHVVAWIDSSVSAGDFLTQVRAAQEAGQRGASPDCPPSGHLQSAPLTETHSVEGEHPENSALQETCARTPTTSPTHTTHTEECEETLSSIAAGEGAAPFVMTGLHACGDLTPTLLRVFVACPQAKAFATVGCCYMKMDIHDPDRGDRELGYPLSGHVARMLGHRLSWEAREMACHFMDAYYTRLTEAHRCPDGEAEAHLQTHCYRAALQEVIALKDPHALHGSIKLTLKKAHRLPFQQYAEKALQRLGLEPSLSAAQVDVAHGRLGRWREVVAFYVLRLSLAPLIESLILLDRLLFLAEHGISGAVLPVFDPAISPRNFVLLASK